MTGLIELRGQDSNLRPRGYEPRELPGCSTPRHLGGCRRIPPRQHSYCSASGADREGESLDISAAIDSRRPRAEWRESPGCDEYANPALSAGSPCLRPMLGMDQLVP